MLMLEDKFYNIILYLYLNTKNFNTQQKLKDLLVH